MSSIEILNPLKRLGQVLNLEKKEISSIYLFAIISGFLQLIIPVGIQAIINFSMAGVITTSLILLITTVLVVIILIGWLQVGQMRIIEKIEQRIFTRYAFEFAWRIPKIDLKHVDDYYMPEVVNRFFDTISFQKSFSKLLLDIPIAIMQVTFGIILLSFYSSIFVIFCLLIIAVIYLILRFTSRKGLETSMQESDYKYQLVAWLEEVARVFKSFHFAKNSTLPVDKTDTIVTHYLESRTAHFKILVAQYWSLIAFKFLITASTLVIGCLLFINNKINVGQFVAAEIVIISVMNAVEKLVQSLDKVYDLLTSIEKLGKIIDKPFEQTGTIDFIDNHAGMAIEIENLNYGYEPNKTLIENLNLNIQAGQKVCITGKVGSGKSTLLKLLTGCYHDFNGSIRLNKLPIGNYNLHSLRSEIGIMFNQTELFQGSLIENITLGDKSISINQILSLSEKIGLLDFISNSKEGLDTFISSMGKKLPNGIAQKILLVRALVGNPKLLLLENPWNEMDEISAQKVKHLLLSNQLPATCLVITNDLSFEANCDLSINFDTQNIIVKNKI
ncbi:MAG: hypothetical protein RIQ33_1854 [Bacteroidota bacterium]|jgi:ABC-type bacteriocin/lantibiotic exporter with double-glycine peptidase domain